MSKSTSTGPRHLAARTPLTERLRARRERREAQWAAWAATNTELKGIS